MQERSFIHAMLHTRKQGEGLAQFREQLQGLTLEDREWFVKQLATEFDIEVVAKPTIGLVRHTSTALVVAHPPQPSFIKGYVSETLSD
jgi:hypothetical protein